MAKYPGNHAGVHNSHWRGGVCLDSDGYVLVKRREHPRADIRGYVKRSILVWEKAHDGVSFPEGMEPHHKNEVKDDDRPENIEPKTHAGHTRDHNLRSAND